jgi:molybdopterin-guanine dinucleotide biosynthesis protein A
VRSAAIVLAGGESRRMGVPKATLEWHGSTLVRRAVGLVGRVVDGPIVVVRAAGQELPPLPAGVELAIDGHAARGPLEGIAAGLDAIGDRADAAFVCGVDAPLLHPALVRLVLAALAAGGEEVEVAAPVAGGFSHPLTAAYRTTVMPRLHALLAADRLRARDLVEGSRAVLLDEAALLADPGVAQLDPDLRSLRNLNHPGEYEVARAHPPPEVTIIGWGTVRAATLAEAGEGRATLNGRAVSDPQEPLVAGDEVAFAMRRRYRPAS